MSLKSSSFVAAWNIIYFELGNINKCYFSSHFRQGVYRFAPGATAVLTSHTVKLEIHETVKKTNEDKENGDVAMDVA